MKANVLKKESVNIKLNKINGDHARLDYHVLMETMPGTDKNYFAIWPSDDSVKGPAIPWRKQPLKTYVMQSDYQDGTITMEDLNLFERGYIIGYSLAAYNPGSQTNNFCSTVYVSSLTSGAEVINKSICIDVDSVEPTSVMIKYDTCVNYRPNDNGNWIGIWDALNDLYVDLPKCASRVESNTQSGEIALDGFPVVAGHSYIVGYFTDGWNVKMSALSRSGLAAITTFTAE